MMPLKQSPMLSHGKLSKLWLAHKTFFFGVAFTSLSGLQLLLAGDVKEKQDADKTRAELRQKGFKTDLSEFDFSTSAETQKRMDAIYDFSAFWAERAALAAGRRPAMSERANRMDSKWINLELLQPIGSNSAVVVWQQETLNFSSDQAEAYNYQQLGLKSGDDLWPALQQLLELHKLDLDAACNAINSGPTRFNLRAQDGNGMLLPHLPKLKAFEQAFGQRIVLGLHQHNLDAAWTNLLASTRLVTAWQIEPVDVSYLVWFNLTTFAYENLWQALQTHEWSDRQLAILQREWESLDFWKNFPATAAFKGSSLVATLNEERKQPLNSGITIKETIRQPGQTLDQFTNYLERIAYRDHGSFEDEKALLLFYRDRELELKNATQAKTWLAMQRLPGVVNAPNFTSKYRSRLVSLINMQQLRAGMLGGGVILRRAAESEARRRLIITVIALERHRLRHASYPKTLEQLVPQFVNAVPMDFMDGKPLRYRSVNEANFYLYSVGSDCTDNGGKMRQKKPGLEDSMAARRGGNSEEGWDLVWPIPASANEAQNHAEQKRADQDMTRQKRESEFEQEYLDDLAARQEDVEKLLAERPSSKEPVYRGKPLSEALQNKNDAKRKTLNELLTPIQILTGEEPQMATFEVPINYNAMTNIGAIRLMVDRPIDQRSADDLEMADEFELQKIKPATNGNCLVVLDTAYYPSGQHAVQVIFVNDDYKNHLEKIGPAVPITTSNLCQFNTAYSHFDQSGATLYARLVESKGVYKIEITSPEGQLVKTFSGTTSNGTVKVRWDLKDEQGRRYTNDSFENIFHVTLPDSGRSQILK